MRNESEKAKVRTLPSWMLVRATNYQTEEQAFVALSWSAARLQNIKEWSLRFDSWSRDQADLRMLHVADCFETYDYHSAIGWVESLPIENGDHADEGVCVYGDAPPLEDWDRLGAGELRMVIRPRCVTWEFLTLGPGFYETELFSFGDKKIFGPYAT